MGREIRWNFEIFFELKSPLPYRPLSSYGKRQKGTPTALGRRWMGGKEGWGKMPDVETPWKRRGKMEAEAIKLDERIVDNAEGDRPGQAE